MPWRARTSERPCDSQPCAREPRHRLDAGARLRLIGGRDAERRRRLRGRRQRRDGNQHGDGDGEAFHRFLYPL